MHTVKTNNVEFISSLFVGYDDILKLIAEAEQCILIGTIYHGIDLELFDLLLYSNNYLTHSYKGFVR